LEYRATAADATMILVTLGTRALQHNQFEPAIRWLEMAQASARDPNPIVQNNLAIAIVRSGQSERLPEALELANKALQLLPDNHVTLATRGEVYLAMKNTKLAQLDLESALQLRPDYPETLQLLAQAATELGDTAGAEEYQRRSQSLKSTNP
jgi:predicted Zn-dependent protease